MSYVSYDSGYWFAHRIDKSEATVDKDEWMVTGIDEHQAHRRFILHDRKRDFTTVAERAESLREAVWGKRSYIVSVVYQEETPTDLNANLDAVGDAIKDMKR
jgi:hypothetical protein